MTILEKAVEEIVKCRASGHISSKLYISFEDLKKLGEERPEILEDGLFYGLNITLLSKGSLLHVLPRK